MEEQDGGGGWSEQGFISGLPNDIVLEHIATKIPWSSMFALTLVNREWRRAIRDREIYKVRKCCRATQLVVAISVKSGSQQGFYDVEHWGVYLFPPQGRFSNGRGPGKVQTAEGTVFLDGKLFALGEFMHGSGLQSIKAGEVQVLDIGACQSEWKHCSSSKIDSGSSICVPCNGKIYAFSMREKLIHGEVFDPKNGTWTEIADKPLNVCQLFAYDERVAALNKEIYVSSVGEKLMVSKKTSVSMVVIDEKLYNISRSSVEVYNPESNSWAVVQPISCRSFMNEVGIIPYAVMVSSFGNEVVALLEHDITFPDGSFRKICKSVGFGVKGQTLMWEILPSFSLQDYLNTHTTSY